MHLRALSIERPDELGDRFPFSVPAIASLESLSFSAPVTFLVGENGSGKSTLLEGIACAVGAVAVGSDNLEKDNTLLAVRRLADTLTLSWTKRTRRGFFLRAEDFFGYAKRLARMRDELERELAAVDGRYEGRSTLAVGLAKQPLRRELNDLQQRYGEGLDAVSHGESFLKLFENRVIPGGLYLLDEPEAALSPLRQLSFLSLLKDMVTRSCQFLIATHSPIILAHAGAQILSFDATPIREVPYDGLEHVTLARSFLACPQRYLDRL